MFKITNKGIIFTFVTFLLVQISAFAISSAYKNELMNINISNLSHDKYSVNLIFKNQFTEPLSLQKKSDEIYQIILPETKLDNSKINVSFDVKNDQNNFNVIIDEYPYIDADLNNGYVKIIIQTNKNYVLSVGSDVSTVDKLIKSAAKTSTSVISKNITSQNVLEDDFDFDNVNVVQKAVAVPIADKTLNISILPENFKFTFDDFQKSDLLTKIMIISACLLGLIILIGIIKMVFSLFKKRDLKNNKYSAMYDSDMSSNVSHDSTDEVTTYLFEDPYEKKDDEQSFENIENAENSKNANQNIENNNDLELFIQDNNSNSDTDMNISEFNEITDTDQHNEQSAIDNIEQEEQHINEIEENIILDEQQKNDDDLSVESEDLNVVEQISVNQNEEINNNELTEYEVSESFEQNIPDENNVGENVEEQEDVSPELPDLPDSLQDNYIYAQINTLEEDIIKESELSEDEIVEFLDNEISKPEVDSSFVNENTKENDTDVDNNVPNTQTEVETTENVTQELPEDVSAEISEENNITDSQNTEEPTLISSINISDTTGFYLTMFDQKIDLIGYVGENIYVIKEFNDLNNVNLQARLSEHNENGDVYIVRLDSYKSLIQVTDTDMKVLIEL